MCRWNAGQTGRGLRPPLADRKLSGLAGEQGGALGALPLIARAGQNCPVRPAVALKDQASPKDSTVPPLALPLL